MIPTALESLDISRLREGRLAEVPFGVLLMALAVHGRTLAVEVRRRQLAKTIALEGGVLVDCRSNLAHETLGRFMVAAGKLGEADFSAQLARSAARGVPLGEVLVEEGLVSPSELFKLLQQNLAKKLLDLFTWREGDFHALPEAPPAGSSLKVRVPQLVVTGITKLAPQEEVDAAVGPLVGKRLALHPVPPFPLAEVRFGPSQTAVVEALKSRPRLDEVAATTGLPFDEINRLVYALGVIGVVTTVDQLPTASATATLQRPEVAPASAPPPAHTAAAPVPAPPPVPTPSTTAPLAAQAEQAEVERLHEEVMQTYLDYRKQDPFDLLRVPEDAAPLAVDLRFLEFAARFAPWRFAGSRFEPTEEKARELFLAGARAYAQLAERESRETLLYRRKTLREERSRRLATEQFAIKTDLLDPEVQYRKGAAAMAAGRYREAVQLLEFASDCDPQNGLYRAELSYCKFLGSPSTAARAAIAGLEEALRIDPRCGIAVFYLGEIHHELGNIGEAETHLQRAIRLMAPDRRPIEALKTLQAKKKR